MQACQADKLKYESFLAEIPDKVLQVLVCETMSSPIERRREVVHKPSNGEERAQTTVSRINPFT